MVWFGRIIVISIGLGALADLSGCVKKTSLGAKAPPPAAQPALDPVEEAPALKIINLPRPVTPVAGLPDNCFHYPDVGGETCVSCKVESVTIHRCFDTKGGFVPSQQCHHTPTEVSCTDAQQGDAITISFRDDEQIRLNEDLPAIFETITSVAQSRLDVSNPDTRFLVEMVGWLKVNSRNILGGINKNKMTSDLGAMLKRRKGLALPTDQIVERFEQGLAALQDKRNHGALKPADGIALAADVLTPLPKSQALLDIMTGLSLEGLDHEHGDP